MKYLVRASQGPSFASPEEAVAVLENVILPTFDAFLALERQGKLSGGLPVADRGFVCIIEAGSHDELDRLLRGLPAWPGLQWEVTPLQSIEGRAAQERANLAAIKGG